MHGPRRTGSGRGLRGESRALACCGGVGGDTDSAAPITESARLRTVPIPWSNAIARSPVTAAPTRGAAAGYRRGARWRRRRPHDRNSTLVRDDPALSDMCMFHMCRRIHRFGSATAISATPQTAFPIRVGPRRISGHAASFGGYPGIRVGPVCSVVEIIRVVNVYAVKDIEPIARSSRSGHGHIEPGGPDTHYGGCDIGFR